MAMLIGVTIDYVISFVPHVKTQIIYTCLVPLNLYNGYKLLTLVHSYVNLQIIYVLSKRQSNISHRNY